jgi:L-iditol 2-dehydrogenase
MKKVKAAVLTGVKKMEIREFPKPEVKAEDALLKVLFCGVCGTDPHLYEGRLPVPYPIVQGHEFCGIIEEMGAKFPKKDMVGKPIKEGDRVVVLAAYNCGECYVCKYYPQRNNLCENGQVYGITIQCTNPPHLFGGFAEYVYLTPKVELYKFPDDIETETIILTDPLAVALRGLELACQPGLPWAGEGFGLTKTVIIQGLGTIGILAAAGAKTMGARKIIGIDGVEKRINMAKKFGVDEVIDISKFNSSQDIINEALRLTDGMGADLVVELAGVPVAFKQGIEMTRRGGKFIELGHFTNAGEISINPSTICFREIDITGVWAYPLSEFVTSARMLEMTKDKFPYSTLVTHKFDVLDAEKAILAATDKTCIKAVVEGK